MMDAAERAAERAKVGETDAPAVDVVALLSTQRDGDLLYDLAKELTKVISAVRETAISGSVTLKLTIAPSTRGDATKVLVRDSVESKEPRPERSPSLFYTTAQGGLSRENPRQRSFREVAPEAGFPEQER